MSDSDGDKVGYKKPPVKTRFKPGQSGNPGGRPKGKRSFPSMLRSALMETIVVTIGGKKRKMSKLDLALTRVANKAVEGDTRAMQQVLGLIPVLQSEAQLGAGVPQADADKEVLAGILSRMLNDSTVASELPPAVESEGGQ